jgi:hypothetical protein
MRTLLSGIGKLVSSGALFVLAAGTALPDAFTVSYLAPGVQTPAGVTTNYETFDGQPAGTSLASPFVTTYGGSGYSGTYTGSLLWYAANQYGGAGGAGVYPEVVDGTSYSLSINPSANYFGVWFSALDAGNLLQFYNGTTLVYTFTPADYIGLVGGCPGGVYCGNPNAAFLGEDNGQQFAYLNFYDPSGTFNNIVFSEIGFAGGGFETDNQAVATLTSAPGGTVLNPVPEPASLGLAGFVLAFLSFQNRKRARR